MTIQILIAGHDIQLNSYLRLILLRHDYEVLIAVDGPEAWDFLQVHGFDLILADVALPYWDGLHLFEKLKAADDPRLGLIPYILVADAAPAAELIRKSQALGVDAFLFLPLAAADLLEVVRLKLLAAERLKSAFFGENKDSG